MNRFTGILASAIIFTGSGFAGQIQIGTGTNGVNGLTVLSGICAASNGPVYTGCVAGGASTSVTETGGKAAALFGTSTNAWPGATGVTYNTPTMTTAMSGGQQSITSNGVTFSMVNNATPEIWAASNQQGVTSTFTIPIGVYGVDEAWTMLNDEFGLNGNSYVNVQFNFGSSSSDTSGDVQSVLLSLTENNQIRDAVSCQSSTATSGQTSTYPVPCSSFALSASSPNTFNVIGGTYTGNTNSNSADYLTKGNLELDAQAYNFATNSAFNAISYGNDYLVSIVITDYAGSTVQGSINDSRLLLSAVTVDQASAAPEPGSLFLLGAGGLVMLLAARRKKASAVR